MSVIIRLQNLPWSANAADIRQYFAGLSIPEGGVHIVGGEKGDAFIAFSTDEDARQAFNRNNGKIKEVQISLLLSSRTEMQKVIEAARNQSMAAFMGVSQASTIAPIMPAIVPKPSSADYKNEKQTDRRRSSRSRSRERYDRRRRDNSRSSSRERNNGDRRRSRRSSRSRERSPDRRPANRDGCRPHQEKPVVVVQQPRVGIWEAPPPNLLAAQANQANVLANLVANNILPNILNPRNNAPPIRNDNAVVVHEQQQFQSRQNLPFVVNNNTNNNVSSTNNGFDNNNVRQNFLPNNQVQINTAPPNANLSNDNYQDENNYEESGIPPNHCIKLYPYYGPYGDVKRFFAPSTIPNDGILFAKNQYNKRNGEVYVNFQYPECKDEALGRTGDRIKNQTVTIEHVSDEEFRESFLGLTDDTLNQQQQQQQQDDRRDYLHLTIEALPNFANSQDVRNIFHEYSLNSIVIEPKGRFKAVYVKFNSSHDAYNAFENKSAHSFEGKPIRVDVCNAEVFDALAREFGTDLVQAPTNKILISGLPAKCSDRDIVDFFSDIGLMPAKIDMIPNEKGFSDKAVCEFRTIEDAVIAFQKNGSLFGNATVSMKYEKHNLPPTQAPSSRPRPFDQGGNNMNNFQNNNRQHQFNNQSGPPPAFRGGGGNNHQRPPHPHLDGGGGNMMMMMGNRGPPQMHRFQNFNNDNDLQHYHHHHMSHDEEEILAPPGCVLLMENVPYKADVADVLNFFDGYNVSGENVLRKFNESGFPTGETKVIFDNPDEVFHAIQEKRGCRIGNRLIYMSQI